MNFSGIYSLEEFAKNKKFKWVDCRHLDGTNCYCDAEASAAIKERMEQLPPKGIHFIDSGNYHYLTKFWTDKINEPFTLIVFDHHPDMQPPLCKGLISCGDWVTDTIRENRYLQKVIIIGVSDKLIKEIPPEYASRAHFYSESELQHTSTWKKFSKAHINEPVYISIDKDVLNKKSAQTNWDQGSMDISRMEELISIIFSHEEIIGVDICGECSTHLDLFEEYRECEVDNRANQSLLNLIEKDYEFMEQENDKNTSPESPTAQLPSDRKP